MRVTGKLGGGAVVVYLVIPFLVEAPFRGKWIITDKILMGGIDKRHRCHFFGVAYAPILNTS